ncbi:hypothetical protein [Micromonospora profundi]|uniref:hypothetical protein n=1 Tax=Micromonospora profundi TaxID=1420889 RepID=UPI003648D6B3
MTIELFRPEERQAARQQWSLDLAGRVLLVAAYRRASLTMPVVRIRWIRRVSAGGAGRCGTASKRTVA